MTKTLIGRISDRFTDLIESIVGPSPPAKTFSPLRRPHVGELVDVNFIYCDEPIVCLVVSMTFQERDGLHYSVLTAAGTVIRYPDFLVHYLST